MKLNNNHMSFLELLRAGLWEKEACLDGSGEIDFDEIYKYTEEQSVQGLILIGLEHTNVKPQQDLLLQWIGTVQLLEQQNKAMNSFVAQLIEDLRSAGVYALLIKGQGIALCYHNPLWRACGDVDLFLSDENYKKAKMFLLPLGEITEPEEAKKKHCAMRIGQWAVELHGTLHSGLASRVDGVLDKVFDDVIYSGHVRSWMNGRTQVFMPGVNCDVVYIFTHILQHFFKGGIGLRQICDWCRFLWTYRDEINKNTLESRLRKAGLMSEWRTFAALAVDFLGMPIIAMPLYDSDEKWSRKAKKIMEFVMEVGNFGRNRDMSYYDKQSYIVRKCISAWRRVKDLCRHARIFPLDSIRFSFGIMYNGILSTLRGE